MPHNKYIFLLTVLPCQIYVVDYTVYNWPQWLVGDTVRLKEYITVYMRADDLVWGVQPADFVSSTEYIPPYLSNYPT